jgi:hypothetical protein
MRLSSLTLLTLPARFVTSVAVLRDLSRINLSCAYRGIREDDRCKPFSRRTRGVLELTRAPEAQALAVYWRLVVRCAQQAPAQRAVDHAPDQNMEPCVLFRQGAKPHRKRLSQARFSNSPRPFRSRARLFPHAEAKHTNGPCRYCITSEGFLLYTLNLICAELYYADDVFRQFRMMRGDEELLHPPPPHKCNAHAANDTAALNHPSTRWPQLLELEAHARDVYPGAKGGGFFNNQTIQARYCQQPLFCSEARGGMATQDEARILP